jgi:hypothetical protein
MSDAQGGTGSAGASDAHAAELVSYVSRQPRDSSPINFLKYLCANSPGPEIADEIALLIHPGDAALGKRFGINVPSTPASRLARCPT